MSDDGFFAEIATAPDEPGPYLVYSDALQLRGDPRGDLISIQHALETADWSVAADLRRREAMLIQANEEAWLGPVLEHREALELRWRYGFVHAARVWTVGALHALMALPAAASTLVELRIGRPKEDGNWSSYQPVIDALAFHPALRRLYITDVDLRGYTRAANVTLDARAKQLDTLVVQTRRLKLVGWDRTPARLRTLVLHTPSVDERALARCTWPRLASVVIPAMTARDAKRVFSRKVTLGKSFDIRHDLDEQRDRQRAAWQKRVEDRAKAYPKLVAKTLDPYWITRAKVDFVAAMDKRVRRDALVEIVRAHEEWMIAPEPSAQSLGYTIGDLCDALVDNHMGECALWKAVTAARWHDDLETEIRALALISTTRWRRGDPNTAAALMDIVLAHYRKQKRPTSIAWALRQRANIDFVRSEFASAEVGYRAALEMYRELEDEANESIVLSELAGALWSRQDFAGAAEMTRQSIAMREPGAFGLGGAYYNLGAILNSMNAHAEAEAAARESLAIFRAHARPDGEAQALSLLGELMQRTNRNAEAEQMLEDALVVHRRRGAAREIGITLGNLANNAMDRADYARAAQLAEEAVELHVECGNKYNEGLQRLDLADAAIGQVRLDDAAVLVEEAIVPMRAIASLPALAAAKIRRGFIAHLRGDLAGAEGHYEDAVADAKRGNYPQLAGWTALYTAVIRAQQQRAEDASALVAQARAIFEGHVQGLAAADTTEAVVARIGGSLAPVPTPRSFDAHVIAMLAR